MNKNHGPSIYFANDKSVFDALHHKSVTRVALKSFLKERGIYVADNIDRDELIDYISSFTFDYVDRQWLVKFLENPNKREKITSQTIKSNSKISGIPALCSAIKDENTDSEDSYRVSTKGDVTTIHVTYTEFDLSKTDLKQRATKTAEIQIQSTGDDLIIRSPVSDKAKTVSDNLIAKIASEHSDEIIQEKISLSSIKLPIARSYFFEVLIKSVPGYRIEDVTKVQVYHEVPDQNGNDDTDDSNENDDVSDQVAGFIRKVALDGGGVLESAEFQQLHQRGFYLSSIIWHIVDELPGGDKVELEAQFSDPEQCSEFNYRVRAIFKYKEREGTHNITRTTPSRAETQVMAQLLENASNIAYQEVLSKYGDKESEEGNA